MAERTKEMGLRRIACLSAAESIFFFCIKTAKNGGY